MQLNKTTRCLAFLLAAYALATFNSALPRLEDNESFQAWSCTLGSGEKMPLGCLSPDSEPSWYNVGGGSAGRPMVARSLGL